VSFHNPKESHAHTLRFVTGCMYTYMLESLKESAKLDEDRRKSKQILRTMRSVDPGYSLLTKLAALQKSRNDLWGFKDKSEVIDKYQCVSS